MADLATVWTAVGSSAVVSAVVGAIASFLSDQRLQKEKAAFDDRLEAVRAALQLQTNAISAEQTRVTNRLQTAFTALQTERATVIKNLYARIVAVEIVLNEIAVTRRVSDDAVVRYRTGVTAFVAYFLPNRIWLPTTVTRQIDELRSLFGSFEKSLAAMPRNVTVDQAFRDGLVVIKGATSQALEDVSASFRDLLGAETGL